ncbi:hypothetical protein [Agrococcus carbonis]|uniref:Uncharacterized protein n=1 Tax=Agrococcus carbonis TaxID=684552 RepID=A0A1H1NTZ7_9MICO|nr:hypothetical protein [Agrococcus carbonis]SDS02432.1 hypothetical protein SAMN04489719_1363 [Agrococcus carbonis]
MEMFELLQTIASASLVALAIAAGTVVALGAVVIGLARGAELLGRRGGRRA